MHDAWQAGVHKFLFWLDWTFRDQRLGWTRNRSIFYVV